MRPHTWRLLRVALAALVVAHLGILAFVFVSGGPARAGTDPTPGQKCAATKRKLAGKKLKALTGCDAKAVVKGVGVDPTCEAMAMSAFMTAWGKVESKGGCATAGDESTIETVVDALRAELDGLLTVTGTMPSKCTAARFKAAGKDGVCQFACMARAALTGIPSSPCLTTCTGKFSAGFAAAEKNGDCRPTGTAALVANHIALFVMGISNARRDSGRSAW